MPSSLKKKRHRGKVAPVHKTRKYQLKCPVGHLLPHETGNGKCTPVYCAVRQAQTAGLKKASAVHAARSAALKAIHQEADTVIDSMIPESVPGYKEARALAKDKKSTEMVNLSHAIGRWNAMKSFFKVPEGLAGADAEEFVRQRAMMLSVDAIAVLEEMLKTGDTKDRLDAAREILDMTGQRKRDSGGSTGPVIMLMGAGGTVPWAQRIEVKNGGAVSTPVGSVEVSPAAPAQRSAGHDVQETVVHGGLPVGTGGVDR